MTYEEALAYVASLEPRGWRLGLDRMQEFLLRAGLATAAGSEISPQFIHIAGTNGKGSVTAYVSSILNAAGYRTGSFFSPFVYDIRERVQVDGELISREDFARITEQLKPFADDLASTEFGGATEFEFKTALGFQHWQEQRCDWVALEVGLGGRLDATNVVHPRCAVIVSIGLDHVNILGNTYAEIAREKAGVIKHGVPVVVGDVNSETWNVIERVAIEAEAPIWKFGREVVLESAGDLWTVHTPAGRVSGLHPGITGIAQPHNVAVSVAAVYAAGLHPEEDALREGVRRAFAPGRFQRAEIEGKTVVLDGAHNTESAQVLSQTMESAYPERKVVLFTNMVAGHEPAGFYLSLSAQVAKTFVVPMSFHRAAKPEDLARQLDNVLSDVSPCDSLQQAIAAIKSLPPGTLVLVTGSFYLVGEMGRALGLSSGRSN